MRRAARRATRASITRTRCPTPTADKAARVAIDQLVLDSAQQNIRSAVLCNTLIYGHGAVAGSASVQLPRLVRQAQKSGVVRHVGSGGNIWSNVHIDDVAELYRLALEKTPAGTFYFVESGEASFRDMSAAIARVMKLGEPQDWPLGEAQKEWGYEMASYGLGSNSRVRGERARKLLGWQPQAHVGDRLDRAGHDGAAGGFVRGVISSGRFQRDFLRGGPEGGNGLARCCSLQPVWCIPAYSYSIGTIASVQSSTSKLGARPLTGRRRGMTIVALAGQSSPSVTYGLGGLRRRGRCCHRGESDLWS